MALVNPNIAMSYRAPEMPNQLANYAAIQQIRGGQQAQEASQMQIDKLKRDEDALNTMMQTITSKGGPRDPMVAADAMIKSGIPHFMDTGVKLQMAHQQTIQDRAAMGLPALGAAAPINAMAPAAPADTLGTGTFGMGAPTNAMAPAPVNALTNKDAQIRQAKEMLLSTTPGVRVAGEQQLRALTTPPVMHSVAPGAALVGPDGKVMYTAPERTDTDLIRNYKAAKAQGFTGTLFDYESRIKAAGRAPAAAPTPAAPVAVMGPNGVPMYVSREDAIKGGMQPVKSGGNEPEKLKPVPVHAQKAIQGAAASIGQLDDAIALLKGVEVGGQKGSKSATGFKAYAPDIALNRMDPSGTVTRAAIADIGSMIMHDRSGAAVTASESPRLKPFIPLITDDAKTAMKKLERLRKIQADEAEALSGTYTPEQGFKTFKVPSKSAPAAAPVIAPPSGFTPDQQ